VWGGALRNLIVTTTLPLQEAEAVAEGIAQTGLATPHETLNWRLEFGAGGKGFFGGRLDVGNHEVQVDWRPMAPIVA
jgi:hypothetical protein